MVLGVYGLGRFGAFWAERLADHAEVRAYSRRSDARPKNVEVVSEDALLECDTLVLCVAISAMRDVLDRIRGRLSPNTLVMDTCSVKVHPTELMRERLPDHVRILGTHPMFGPDSGRDTIVGKPMILSPVRIDEPTLVVVCELFERQGLRVQQMTPDAHDREAAFTQGVTHYIGRILADLRLRESTIATLGYQRLLSIVEQTCNDPWQLFEDLQRFNPHTAEMRSRLDDSISRVSDRLDSIQDHS